jgi:UDP-glucose 4-epimerase
MRANLAALERAADGAINVGTGVETSVNELYRLLAAAAETKLGAEYGPPRPGEQHRSVISPARAARDLGWRPEVALADGLARTFAFFKDRLAQRR